MSNEPQLFYFILLAGLLLSSLFMHYRKQGGTALRHGLLWVLLFFIGVSAYAYKGSVKDLFTPIIATLFPSSAIDEGEGLLYFNRASDGHYHIDATVNQVPITFLLDTGASDIVFSKETASDIGIPTQTLRYNIPLSTANGRAMGARITLASLSIGNYTVNNISAIVTNGKMDSSLLGMSFLNRMKGFDITGDRLQIRWGK
jgi:aspartyl protease family protein